MMGNSNGKNQPNAQKIQVTDIYLNSSTLYNSINEAARALNLPHCRITQYFTNNQYQKKPYKGRYIFTLYTKSYNYYSIATLFCFSTKFSFIFSFN
jgi:hypothetical protein